MSGPDLYDRVKRENPAQAERFVFMTGTALTSQSQHFLAATTQPWIQKPFENDALRKLVRKFLFNA
jgi:CheY-like chemotaxis protein